MSRRSGVEAGHRVLIEEIRIDSYTALENLKNMFGVCDTFDSEVTATRSICLIFSYVKLTYFTVVNCEFSANGTCQEDASLK